MVLLIRFAPGLRIALAAACAWADVPPRTILVLEPAVGVRLGRRTAGPRRVAGPAYLARFGLAGWRGALAVGLTLLVLFRVLGRYERRAIERME